MTKLLARAKNFVLGEDALELSEYALMLALIVIALLLVIGLLRNAISNRFSQAASVIDT